MFSVSKLLLQEAILYSSEPDGRRGGGHMLAQRAQGTVLVLNYRAGCVSQAFDRFFFYLFLFNFFETRSHVVRSLLRLTAQERMTFSFWVSCLCLLSAGVSPGHCNH